MIKSTKGKLAANAVNGEYGKGFPVDLVKRIRAKLSAPDAAVAVEDLRFPPGNQLKNWKATGQSNIACGSMTNGAFALSGRRTVLTMLKLQTTTE